MDGRSMRLLLFSLASVFLLGASESPQEEAAEALITENVLRAHVRFLASDLLEGRAPATRGDALSEAYIASQFEALGLKPAGSEGYRQPFELLGVLGHPDVLTFSAQGRTLSLNVPTEAIASSGNAAEQTRLLGAEVRRGEEELLSAPGRLHHLPGVASRGVAVDDDDAGRAQPLAHLHLVRPAPVVQARLAREEGRVVGRVVVHH